MPRHNRRRAEEELQVRAAGAERRESWHGTDYAVRTVPASRAIKAYRCPGCDQVVAVGVPHVVVWPSGDLEAGDRRHWHTACWTARDRRAPTRRR